MIVPVPAISRTDLLLAKAEPITVVVVPLKKGSKLNPVKSPAEEEGVAQTMCDELSTSPFSVPLGCGRGGGKTNLD